MPDTPDPRLTLRICATVAGWLVEDVRAIPCDFPDEPCLVDLLENPVDAPDTRSWCPTCAAFWHLEMAIALREMARRDRPEGPAGRRHPAGETIDLGQD